MKHLTLIGLPGCGKSTVAKRISDELDLPCSDLDAEVELSAGKTISQIFAEEGEEIFRDMETACLRDLLTRSSRIIACGGGAVLREENRMLLRSTDVVWIKRSVENIMLTCELSWRPLLNKYTLCQLDKQRTPLYEACANIVVAKDNLEDIVRAITTFWREENTTCGF